LDVREFSLEVVAVLRRRRVPGLHRSNCRCAENVAPAGRRTTLCVRRLASAGASNLASLDTVLARLRADGPLRRQWQRVALARGACAVQARAGVMPAG